MKIKNIKKIPYAGDVYNLRIKSDTGLNHNYIANNINVSNCHKSRGDSITDILESCTNWKYKLGLSGTLKLNEEYSDFFKMQQNIGPLVMVLGAKFLIDKDYSPNIKIKQVFLEYPSSDPTVNEYLRIQRDSELKAKIKSQFRDPKDYGKHMLEIEKGIIFDSQSRLDFLSRLVQKFDKNTLILFSDIKNEYGLSLCKSLQTWNQNTFYIDGGVENENREEYKDIMESPDQMTILKFNGNIEIKVNQFKRVKLTDGSTKLAKDITLDDDIDNLWIDANK